MKFKAILIIILLFITPNFIFSQSIEDDFTISGVSQKLIEFFPSSEQIDKMKKETKELDDFYIVADDILYYRYLANQYLSKNNISFDTINSSNKCFYLKEENKRLCIPEDFEFGGFFIYERGKYAEFVDYLDIRFNWKYIDGHWEKDTD